MHTIVVISDKACIDEYLRKYVEAIFPECRIKLITVADTKPEHHSPRVAGNDQ